MQYISSPFKHRELFSFSSHSHWFADRLKRLILEVILLFWQNWIFIIVLLAILWTNRAFWRRGTSLSEVSCFYLIYLLNYFQCQTLMYFLRKDVLAMILYHFFVLKLKIYGQEQSLFFIGQQFSFPLLANTCTLFITYIFLCDLNVAIFVERVLSNTIIKRKLLKAHSIQSTLKLLINILQHLFFSHLPCSFIQFFLRKN